MSGVFVAGTDTGVGKTLAACALLHALRRRYARVVGMKPVAAGTIRIGTAWCSEDAVALRAASSIAVPPELDNPVLLAEPMSPHLAAARAGVRIMLDEGHAEQLRDAGLDYYNHNLDSAPEFYGEIISTRDYQDRLDTLSRVRGAGVKVCCGGIVGMGESRAQRAGLIAQLANLQPYPESVPINHLVRVAGSPLANQEPLDPFEFVRTIAVARITMPRARVRLSAGRQQMGDAVRALCFQAGANSIFYGDKLLTTGNPDTEADLGLLRRLGLRAGQPEPLVSAVGE